MLNPGAAGAGAGGAAPAKGLATDPVIPPMMGECPNFDSGSGTIMGARLSFLAAKKSAGKGSLVFYWHGTGSSPIEGSMFGGIADINKDGGLVVGFSSGTGAGGDCSGTGTHSINDFKVADQVVACSVANYGIDPKRIYATGCSAGGLQTGCMSINRSAYIAAVATNSGGVTAGCRRRNCRLLKHQRGLRQLDVGQRRLRVGVQPRRRPLRCACRPPSLGLAVHERSSFRHTPFALRERRCAHELPQVLQSLDDDGYQAARW
jgi:hypothetical protein